jgi:RNA polymerase II elongation factor ELL
MTLKIPDGGLLLEGPSGKDPNVPPQAFAITLNDNIIESLIKCVQNGENLELALGKTPTLHYGSQSHRLSPPSDSFPLDLYLTQPYESTREAKRIPCTSSLFEKPKEMVEEAAPKKVAHDSASAVKSKTKATTKSSTSSSGLESDLETLQNGLAAHDASRERTRVISKPPATKKGAAAARGKLLPGYASNGRSLSTSPALNAVRSPSETPGFSASQQVVERKKEQRSTLVHELAVKDRSLDYLQAKWNGKQEELQPTLEKVADHMADTKLWAMKKAYWKELDVWNYDYDTQKERQTAIDNAVRQYDKQRMSASEPEWQKLLPKEERGKGKCLSVLQASLAKKNTTEALTVEPSRDGGEAMARSSSNPLPSKAKKPTAQEAQAKRLLGKSKPSSAAVAPAAPPSSSSSAPRPSPTKAKPAASKANNGRVLSKEFIENSDSSGDEVPVAQAKPKPAPKPVAKPASTTKETVVVKSKPLIREPPKPQPPTKRPREDEESSSSSGTPLSKRIKDKQILHPPSTLKRRTIEATQTSKVVSTGSTLKNKATSPTKSSPLASSPPTNASDLENETARQVIKKRKAEAEARSLPPSKRTTARHVSSEVLDQAQTFKLFYQKYEALHYEISALDNPPDEKVANLIDMRGRLQTMKNEIYKQYASDRE